MLIDSQEVVRNNTETLLEIKQKQKYSFSLGEQFRLPWQKIIEWMV